MRHYSLNYIYNLSLRYIYRSLNLRPASYPYISGDTFRQIASYKLESSKKKSPYKIKKYDILFVESEKLKYFFTEIAPSIKNRFILISHNGDTNITDDYKTYLKSEKIIHWFAQNCLITDPKITPIPIGLENKWFHLHGKPKYFDSLKLKPTNKKTQIFYKFSVATNVKERTSALDTLNKHPLAVSYNEWREPLAYLKTLQKYKFVLSPPGNGVDCIRTWEAMYLDTVPILKRDSMSQYFYDCGLPIMLVDEWSDLLHLTEKELDDKYDILSTRFSCEALKTQYWITKILSKIQ